MSFIRKRAALIMTGLDRGAIADVVDAHLETLSMIFLTTCWAVGYGWFEAVIGIGALLGIPGGASGNVQWYSFLGVLYSSYHLFLGFTIFCLTFGIGFLKFNRMLYARKRYLLFTSLASYPWALTVQDFAYFFFAPTFNAGNASLNNHAWTCGGLGLGCVTLANPWKPDIPFIIPRWYGVTLLIAGVLYFLAYRSALVDLLVTREVMKEAGFAEKIRISDLPAPTKRELPKPPVSTKVHTTIPAEIPTPAKSEAAKILDKDREELVRRLRERLEGKRG